MELLIIRHGLAGDKTAWAKKGRPDAERPLTKEGRRKLKEAAPGLAKVFGKAELLASSPLVRALQTAELLPKRWANRRWPRSLRSLPRPSRRRPWPGSPASNRARSPSSVMSLISAG